MDNCNNYYSYIGACGSKQTKTIKFLETQVKLNDWILSINSTTIDLAFIDYAWMKLMVRYIKNSSKNPKHYYNWMHLCGSWSLIIYISFCLLPIDHYEYVQAIKIRLTKIHFFFVFTILVLRKKNDENITQQKKKKIN